jgi:hypothetical protein
MKEKVRLQDQREVSQGCVRREVRTSKQEEEEEWRRGPRSQKKVKNVLLDALLGLFDLPQHLIVGYGRLHCWGSAELPHLVNLGLLTWPLYGCPPCQPPAGG